MKNIRKKALKLLNDRQDPNINYDSKKEIKKIFHDLRVHQIELELQNEELQNLQQDLEASKHKYVELFDQAPVGYVVLDQKGGIIDINSTLLKMLGKNPETFTTKYFQDLLHGESRQIFLSRFKAIYKLPNNKALDISVQIEGEKKYLELRSEKIKYSLESEEYLFLSATDITEKYSDKEKILRLNIVLDSIRKINREISQETNIDKLSQKVVNILGGTRGYKYAWIARLDRNYSNYTKFYAYKKTAAFKQFEQNLINHNLNYCISRAIESNEVIEATFDEEKCKGCPVCTTDVLSCSLSSVIRYDNNMYGLISVGLDFEFMRTANEKKLFGEIVSDLAYAFHAAEMEERRKRIEKNLEEQEERYRNLFNKARDAFIITIPKDHRIVNLNSRAVDLFNDTKENLIGKKLDTFLTPESKKQYTNNLSTLNDDLPMELSIQREDSTIPVELSQNDVKISQEKYNFAIVRDISQREKLLNDLNREKNLIDRIVNTTPSGISLVDKSGKITYANKKARDILNIQSIDGEYTYNDPRFKITDLDGNPFPSEKLPYTIVKKTKQTVHNIKHAITWENGDQVFLSISSSPLLDKAGNFSGMISVFDDITTIVNNEEKRIELEKSLNRSQKLETIGTLAGGIAHDFNNILTPILGYADMIMNVELSRTEIKDNVKDIYHAALRARDLVSQILSFSRQAEQNRKPLYVHPVIKEALKLLRPSIPTTIDIKTDIDTTIKKILADPSKIHQLIVNLCTNSFQAMEETGGELFIGLQQVSIEQAESSKYIDLLPGDYIKLTVKDTGVGMAPEITEKIFEPFFTTKSVDKGTGLGLSVVHGIVKSHDGVITLDSKPNQGTRFDIYFPIFISDNDIVKTKSAKLNKGSESIILVDDKQLVTNMVNKVLTSLGYHVVTFNNSLTALKKFKENPANYNLLITDLTMPEMTGLKLSREVKKIKPNFPIIMMTGYGAKITEEEQKKAGILKILTKPILINELSSEIRKIFDEYK